MTNINLEFDGPAAHITLNQPQRKNAMSQAMWLALSEAVAEVDASASTRVVIIRGAGDTFCAGADISEFGSVYATPATAQQASAAIDTALKAVEALKVPSISVIQGACMGGGCALALACDLQIADHSAKFGVNPTALGTAYSYADSARLAARIGISRTRLMLMGARIIDAPTGLDWGLVCELLDADGLNAHVAALAGDIARRSPTALAASKRILRGVEHGAELNEHAQAELHNAFQDCFNSGDFAEGTQAFLNKRQPEF